MDEKWVTGLSRGAVVVGVGLTGAGIYSLVKNNTNTPAIPKADPDVVAMQQLANAAHHLTESSERALDAMVGL